MRTLQRTLGFAGLIFFAIQITMNSVLAASLIWDGATGDFNWSSDSVTDPGRGNWTTAGAPVNGDDITFDATSANISTINDIANLSLTKITVSNASGTVSIANNALTLTGAGGVGIDLNGGGNLTITPTLTLGGALSFDVANGQTLTVAGISQAGNLLTLNGGTITLNGQITGGGGITVASGTTTITGNNNNNFTGAVSISNGATLIIDDANGLGGTGAGTTVLSGGTLTLQGGITTAAEALAISGTGVGGNGALRNLSGANIFSGAITLGAASTITSTAGTLTLNNTIDNGGFTATFAATGDVSSSGAISGAGGLTKTGTGTLTLTGNNTYAGATTISAGIVNIQHANALGTTAAGTTVANGASLQLQGGITTGAEALTINGAGGGNGALRNISGANTYGGAITLGSASTIASDASTLTMSSTIANGGFTLTMTGAGDLTSGGIISGTGGLTKTGAGTITFNAINTYSGATAFNAGTAVYGANYTGNGTITVGAAGTMYAGSRTLTTPTLTINGNFTAGTVSTAGNANISGDLAGSGTFNVRFQSNTAYDKLTLTGAASVANVGSLTLTPTFSYSPASGTQYTIVEATGGGSVTGTFTMSPLTLSPTLQANLIYSSTSVILAVQNTLNSSALNLSPTQLGVANSLTTAPTSTDLNQVFVALGQLTTADQVKVAYGEISPAKLENLVDSSFSAASEQTGNIGARMNALHTGTGGTFSFVDNHSASWSFDGVLLADNEPTMQALSKVRVAPRYSVESPRWGVFANGSGTFGEQDSTAGRTGYEFVTAGTTMGVDYKFNDHFALGLAGGYTRTETTLDASGGQARVDTVTAGPYMNLHSNDEDTDIYLNSTLTYGHNFYHTERHIAFSTIDRTAKGDPDGDQVSGLVATGYDVKLGNFIFGPTASVNYSKQWIDSFTEQNAGALNLTIQDQTAESLQSGVGAHLSYTWKLPEFTMIPNVFASYQHEFMNDSRAIRASVAGGSTFQTQTASPHRDFANLGAGVNFLFSPQLSANLSYGTIVGDSTYQEHTMTGGVRYNF